MTLRPALSLLVLALVAVVPCRAEVAAADAFNRLKGLAGTWKGQGEGGPAPAEVVHEFRVSAVGSVVMETMFPGTGEEMINMYHLDGEELVVTHYCAAGNQPQMKLDRAASSADHLLFAYTGGMNHDPATDQHIHEAELTFLPEGGLESCWTSYQAGQPYATMKFHLARSE